MGVEEAKTIIKSIEEELDVTLFEDFESEEEVKIISKEEFKELAKKAKKAQMNKNQRDAQIDPVDYILETAFEITDE
jgi:hypothetical protein